MEESGRAAPTFFHRPRAGKAAGWTPDAPDGDLEDGIVTCPEHGSQFEVCSGDRVRGPSDYRVQTYPAAFDGDDLYVEI